MLTYLIKVQLSGGRPFFFLAREEDIGRPNKVENWATKTQTKLRGFQIQKGERNHHLTTVNVEATLSCLPYGPTFLPLGGTQSSSPKKIFELASPQLDFPIFA